MCFQFRNVRLKRHPDGGLGFSVKGGVEHNLPILVSKVCRNEDDDHLYIGDAILKVNHRSLGAVTHDEALDLLRGAGDQVSLTVKHYKSAAPFLLKQLRQMIPEMDDTAKGTASPYVHYCFQFTKMSLKNMQKSYISCFKSCFATLYLHKLILCRN